MLSRRVGNIAISVRYLILLVAVLGLAVAILAAGAPALGLGSHEGFVGYRAFGLTRSDLFFAGIVTGGGAIALLGLLLAAPAALSAVASAKRHVQTTAIVLLSAAGALLTAEVYLRLNVPFSVPYWPIRFDRELGFVFEPGAEVRWTNGVDFWTRTRVNADGMLDRPRRGPKLPGTCRILFVGDSFVEAAQVRIDEKVQSAIERVASSRTGLPPIEAAAVGIAGTGQAAQLPLYERIGRHFEADVVVLVFVSNDFADNSVAFAAVMHGWHPDHSPRVFFVPDGEAGDFRRTPIDPDWRTYFFPGPSTANDTTIFTRIASESRLYGFVRGHMSALFPARGPNPQREARAAWLVGLEGYERSLEGWDRAKYPEPSAAFFDAQMHALPAFAGAIEATRAAIVEFKKLAIEDGAQLVVLGTHNLRGPSAQTVALRSILGPLGIPYVDQSDFIRSLGRDPADANFKRDGHWNATGHEWAAMAMVEWLTNHRTVCFPKG